MPPPLGEFRFAAAALYVSHYPRQTAEWRAGQSQPVFCHRGQLAPACHQAANRTAHQLQRCAVLAKRASRSSRLQRCRRHLHPPRSTPLQHGHQRRFCLMKFFVPCVGRQRGVHPSTDYSRLVIEPFSNHYRTIYGTKTIILNIFKGTSKNCFMMISRFFFSRLLV